jgi:hypothetical protein
MLWLDIGAFCGYRRKMEIAESNLQGLVTVLPPPIYTHTRLNNKGTSARRKVRSYKILFHNTKCGRWRRRTGKEVAEMG